MLLSVCVVNWNTRDFLRECLAALRNCPPRTSIQSPIIGAEGPTMELIVVDNSSADHSAEMVASEFPEVQLIANCKNLGYAMGNNQALQHASGDWILLLNPDVIVHDDTLTNAIAFAAQHPEAAAVGARLIGANGETQRSIRAFPDPAPVLWEYLGLGRLFPKSRRFAAYRMDWLDYDQPAEVDQPMGSFLLISRHALTTVGLFDPQFPIVFNEVDWCFRARREHGLKIYYAPSIAATHYGGESTKQIKARMVTESHRSLLRFYEKHYKNDLPLPLYWLIGQAVLWNERRLLRRIKKTSATT